jgi:hypothetical protein
MENLEKEFGTMDTDKVELPDSALTVSSDADKIKSQINEKIGDMQILDFVPDERYDPEDTKWDQIVKFGSGEIAELRSSNMLVPSLCLGMKVIYGSKIFREEARIAKFEERKRSDDPGKDTPVIILKAGEKTVRIYDPREILKVEEPLPDHLRNKNQTNWVCANLSLELPDVTLATYYREKFQETAENESFFISVNELLMLIRIQEDRTLTDSTAKITIEKNGQAIMQGTFQLQNGFKYINLPDEIELTDVIKVELFKKPIP